MLMMGQHQTANHPPNPKRQLSKAIYRRLAILHLNRRWPRGSGVSTPDIAAKQGETLPVLEL